MTSNTASNLIEFCFIPPRAPHFGGLWEAAVKSAQVHLFRTLSNAKLTFEELSTALVEIQAVVNSRLISSTSSDANDFEALTPGHFLIGGPLKHIPEKNNFTSDISSIQHWQRITAIKTHFRNRWHQEYLANLQQQTRWRTPQQNLKVNDMVLVHEDNLHPMKWVIVGAECHARVADVKTLTTTFRRLVAKLALLPACWLTLLI